MSQLLEVQCDSLVFAAELKGGVPSISAKTEKTAKRIAKELKCKISRCEGDFDTTTFFLDRELTEDEVEAIDAKYVGR